MGYSITKGNHVRKSPDMPKIRRGLVVGVVLASMTMLAACGGGSGDAEVSSGDDATPVAGADFNLISPGTLTVGMNLQFPPQMYLDESDEPAGYDVTLLNGLAEELGLELKIENLDFNGLIPGLQSKKFDMVSVGLTNTPERAQVIDFSREYVPYTSVLAVAEDDSLAPSIDSYNTGDTVITALQGSSGEQLAKDTFPDAEITGFADQNAALLQVATGRAQGSVLEDYILANYQESNPGQVKKAELPEPLSIGYGSWAVQKGNSALQSALDSYLCGQQTSGGLADAYEQAFGLPASDFPPMPAGC